jgi:hypothetical protein
MVSPRVSVAQTNAMVTVLKATFTAFAQAHMRTLMTAVTRTVEPLTGVGYFVCSQPLFNPGKIQYEQFDLRQVPLWQLQLSI